MLIDRHISPTGFREFGTVARLRGGASFVLCAGVLMA